MHLHHQHLNSPSKGMKHDRPPFRHGSVCQRLKFARCGCLVAPHRAPRKPKSRQNSLTPKGRSAPKGLFPSHVFHTSSLACTSGLPIPADMTSAPAPRQPANSQTYWWRMSLVILECWARTRPPCKCRTALRDTPQSRYASVSTSLM